MGYRFGSASTDKLALGRGFREPALAVALGTAGLALLIDLNTPLGVADGFLYVLAVLVCFWLPNPKAVLYVATALMLPMAIGLARTPPEASVWIEGTNRLLGAATIWLTAILIWHNARLTAERTRVLAELARQDHNRERFLAALGHELRDPIAAIQFGLRRIISEDPSTQRALPLLKRQSQHMAYLIDDLSDISRINHGKLRLKRQIVDLNQSALEVTEQLRGPVEAKGLGLELTLAAQPVHVDADPHRIAQVLGNLLRNALNYTSAGCITVTVGANSGRALLSVHDTGEGIEADEAAALFEPFRQATTRSITGGLGLGLTLVKQLVEIHGGTVALHSAGRGAGSEFMITMPLARASLAVEARHAHSKYFQGTHVVVR